MSQHQHKLHYLLIILIKECYLYFCIIRAVKPSLFLHFINLANVSLLPIPKLLPGSIICKADGNTQSLLRWLEYGYATASGLPCFWEFPCGTWWWKLHRGWGVEDLLQRMQSTATSSPRWPYSRSVENQKIFYLRKYWIIFLKTK